MCIPKQIKNKEKTAQVLSKILECRVEEVSVHFNKNVSVEILKPVGKKIEVDKAIEIIKSNLPGIYVVADTKRYYPYQHYLAQVIGIVGIDNQGISGVEYIYDEYLKGSSGAVQILTDAHGELIANENGKYKAPTSGFDVYLSIDIDIQVSLERVMDNAVTQYKADEIIGLVMNPKNSEVLAMASRPTFNPEFYQEYSQELYNRNLPIWKSFEPGSTFKIVTFSAGLEEKVFKPVSYTHLTLPTNSLV